MVKPKMKKKSGYGQFGAFQSGEETAAGFQRHRCVVGRITYQDAIELSQVLIISNVF
jgi:hypothetical protein